MSINNSMKIKLRERIQKHSDGTIERWRDVPGYEGLYRVSDRGRVKSLTRYEKCGHMMRIRRSRMLKLFVTKRKYVNANLSINGDGYPYRVHFLVLLSFVGPRLNGMECCHNDGNPLNNQLENLRWGTHRENENDKKRNGHPLLGERNPNAVLTKSKVRKIRELYATRKYRYIDLSAIFKIDPTTICQIVRRKTWKDV